MKLTTTVTALSLGLMLTAQAAAPAPGGATPAAGNNSPLGTWKLNLKESVAPQGSHFRAYTVVVRRADAVLDFSYTSKDDNGQPFDFSYSGPADGKVREVGSGASKMKAAMILLPSGNYEARLWEPDGMYENKFCQLLAGGNRQVCLATLTAPAGQVIFFKQVLDRQ